MLIDVIVAALIVVFFILGVLQGFIISLLILVAWVVGILSVWLFSGFFAALLNANVNLIPPLDLLLGGVLAFFFPFLAIRIIISIIKYLLNKTSSLTMANRILGGLWGILKGIVISVVFLTVISVFPPKGNLQQTIEESVAYSIYRGLPFADIWKKFKTEIEEFKIEI